MFKVYKLVTGEEATLLSTFMAHTWTWEFTEKLRKEYSHYVMLLLVTPDGQMFSYGGKRD